jgi:hypothetical protein
MARSTASLLDAPLGRGHFAVCHLHSDLSAERWVFYYFADEHALTLDIYQRLTRPTKRHGWKVEDSYARLASSRDQSKLEHPPLPDDVKREALAAFIQNVRVCMWKEIRR